MMIEDVSRLVKLTEEWFVRLNYITSCVKTTETPPSTVD